MHNRIQVGARKKNLERVIARAINFLYDSQLAYGEFKTYAASDETMSEECRFDSSPFATAFVLYSISFWRDARVRVMTARGLDFLRSEMEGNGLWRYWSSRNELRDVLPPDLDDTACISFILKKHQQPIANRELILANRTRDGLFYTWLIPRANCTPNLANEIPRAVNASALTLFSISGTLDNIDCAVNANGLLYLGECEETQPAIGYLNHSVLEEEICSSYYADRLAFYYMFSRACFNGASSLGETRSAVMNRITARQERDGSFGNELLTALAICTWLNFKEPRDGLERAIESLLQTQSQGGSWKKIPLWLGPAPYYGSEELTTALCVEALSRYLL